MGVVCTDHAWYQDARERQDRLIRAAEERARGEAKRAAKKVRAEAEEAARRARQAAAAEKPKNNKPQVRVEFLRLRASELPDLQEGHYNGRGYGDCSAAVVVEGDYVIVKVSSSSPELLSSFKLAFLRQQFTSPYCRLSDKARRTILRASAQG